MARRTTQEEVAAHADEVLALLASTRVMLNAAKVARMNGAGWGTVLDLIDVADKSIADFFDAHELVVEGMENA